MQNGRELSRRTLLQALIAAPILQEHGQIKPPAPAPDISLIRQDGAPLKLSALTSGRVTAVQLMFTGCTTTCPIEAAIFAQVQRLIPGMHTKSIQLLSLSVNSAKDNPGLLAAWLKRFHAGPGWIAAAPVLTDAAVAKRFFQGDARGDHSTQVSILNRNGCLVWRTSELPAAEEVSAILRAVCSSAA